MPPGADRLSGDLDVLGGHPAPSGVRDVEVAQQFLDGGGDPPRGVGVPQLRRLVGVFEQRERAEGDHAGRRPVPGEEQQNPRPRRDQRGGYVLFR